MNTRADQCNRFGRTEVLVLRKTPVLSSCAIEMLVRVHASGISPKKAAIRASETRLVIRAAFPRVLLVSPSRHEESRMT
jgi:NADPH:quinone reductase-like Zn-dependent oxidoreductase